MFREVNRYKYRLWHYPTTQVCTEVKEITLVSQNSTWEQLSHTHWALNFNLQMLPVTSLLQCIPCPFSNKCVISIEGEFHMVSFNHLAFLFFPPSHNPQRRADGDVHLIILWLPLQLGLQGKGWNYICLRPSLLCLGAFTGPQPQCRQTILKVMLTLKSLALIVTCLYLITAPDR